ncbi:MAG: PspA/IM30 family protein [Longimicrobiales bacterium]|nr:PspA/IM30 family protein [Longimicrobiales bacterium]
MGIFSKFSTLLKSNINDLINRAEDPEKMLNQIILDMRDQLAKAKREVAAAIADEHKLKQQLEDEVKQAREWENRAMLAVQEGRDDLAKQALMRQQEHAERARQLDDTWRAQSSETEKLRGSLRQLNEKIEEAKRKRNLLIAKQKRAQAQRKIHETMSGLSDSSAFEAFNRMADKIEESERKSIAAATINEDLTHDSLEDQFKQIEKGGASGAAEGRLLELKRQMGLIAAAPEDDAVKQLEAGEEEGDAAGASEADAATSGEVEVDAVEEDADDGISEAELLEHFKGLEKNAEA